MQADSRKRRLQAAETDSTELRSAPRALADVDLTRQFDQVSSHGITATSTSTVR